MANKNYNFTHIINTGGGYANNTIMSPFKEIFQAICLLFVVFIVKYT